MRSCAVYLLACNDGRTYTGISADPQARFQLHKAGKGSFFTRLNPPTKMIAQVWIEDRPGAAIIERKLKRRSQMQRLAWFERMEPSAPLRPHRLATALDSL